MHTMQEETEEFFRNAFQTPPGEELPERLVEYYWTVKRTADRTSVRLSSTDLMWIALQCGHPLPGPKQRTALDEFQEGALKIGDAVTARFRNQWKPGVLRGTDSDGNLLVQFDGQADDRSIKPEWVRARAGEPVEV